MNTNDQTFVNAQEKTGIDQSVQTAVVESDDDDWLMGTEAGYAPEDPAGDICEACQ